ncbi:PSD1 and planctomycete cytochrome C domain-containing protein [bacterium]|nr:PSD1 and planctomycete cytochrome C domain-containing protein [bacterium]
MSLSARAYPVIMAACVAPLWAEAVPVDYQKSIRAILSDNCYHCHGPDEKTREAGLRLDLREPAFASRDAGKAIEPGQPDASLLLQRMISTDPDLQMPPPDSGRKLSQTQIELVRTWIAQGAPWKDHWAFVPPQQQPWPSTTPIEGANNPLDPFVLSRLHQEGLSPSKPASRETLARRLSLDLVGLPPLPVEVQAVAADSMPDAVDRFIDRLFASPRYGEHHAAEWLDAARYADTNGYQNDGTRTQWPWRDWVVRSFNANLPFDRFIQQQMAGDLLPDSTIEDKIATGFHRNHPLNGEGGRIPEESRIEYCVDRVDTTATVFLGLTLGCARCHDHKYDPFTQKDYYRLFAFFNSIDEVGGVDRGGNAFPTIKMPTPDQTTKKEELLAQIVLGEKELAQPPDTSEGAQIAWEASIVESARQKGIQSVWQPLVPDHLESAQGATLARQEDLSIFVSGTNPENDVYRVIAPVPTSPITGLLLEALSHPEFTQGGLARSDSGNFVLTRVRVLLHQPDGGEPVSIPIKHARADFEQPGYSIAQAIDDQDRTGWAILSNDMKRDRQGVFVFRDAVPIELGSKLEVVLESLSPHKQHNLGRFRLSVSSRPEPTLPVIDPAPEFVLAAAFVPSVHRSSDYQSALRGYFQQIATERPALKARLDQLRSERSRLDDLMLETMVLADRAEPRKTYRLERGLYDKPDTSAELTPGLPSVLAGADAASTGSRLLLANWLISPEQPLTSRVTVNRWWQHFFGQGIVRTAEDFGSQGELPTHPELLDWLAVECQQSGWDMKGIHRLLVSSQTYQQSSMVNASLLEKDPENRLYARGPRHRLTASMLRDQALFLAGLWVDTMGGPGVNPYQPANVWTDFSLGKIQYQQGKGSDLYRRSLYTFWRRSVGPTMFFDASTRQVCEVRRRLTNTPLQALTLLNDTTFVEAARVLAERTLRESPVGSSDRLAWAFESASLRQPTDVEKEILLARLQSAQAYFAKHPEEATALLKVGDWPASSAWPPTELASYTVVMNVILNLDEVMTKE